MVENNRNNTPEYNHRGETRSYIIGLLLSLVLTIIPYFMVVWQVTSGKKLLLAILGFAIIQMFVQMFFFLHLGRGPKPFYNIVFFVGTAGLIIMVVGASIWIMDNLYRNMSPEEVITRIAQEENIAELGGRLTGACQGNKGNHIVTLSSTEVTPSHIEAKRCDTLTIKSGDGERYELKFGPHDNPISYGGLYEVPVRSDRSKIITLNEAGTFSFFDSTSPEITGSFTVTADSQH